jgi:tRNA-specific 2-thiouridylase
VTAKIRYNMSAAEATVEPGDNEGQVILRFHEPQRAITPGQSLVMYDGDSVVGGGTIQKRLSSREMAHYG